MEQNNMTPEQQKVLNDMAEYGKHLQELAYENTGKYVVAGYAGDSTDSSKLYCYCGDGNGYKGAPLIRPTVQRWCTPAKQPPSAKPACLSTVTAMASA